MNSERRAELIAETKGWKYGDKFWHYYRASLSNNCFLDAAELAVSSEFVWRYLQSNTVFFHGGPAGLGVGSTLVPSARSGLTSYPRTLEHVYFTPHIEHATGYARRWSPGCIYRVEAIGEIFLDPLYCSLRTLLASDPEVPRNAGVNDDVFARHYCARSAVVVEVIGHPPISAVTDHPG